MQGPCASLEGDGAPRTAGHPCRKAVTMSLWDWIVSFFKPKPAPTPPVAPPAIKSAAFFDDYTGPANATPPYPWQIRVIADQSSGHTDYPRNACLDGQSHLNITA